MECGGFFLDGFLVAREPLAGLLLELLERGVLESVGLARGFGKRLLVNFLHLLGGRRHELGAAFIGDLDSMLEVGHRDGNLRHGIGVDRGKRGLVVARELVAKRGDARRDVGELLLGGGEFFPEIVGEIGLARDAREVGLGERRHLEKLLDGRVVGCDLFSEAFDGLCPLKENRFLFFEFFADLLEPLYRRDGLCLLNVKTDRGFIEPSRPLPDKRVEIILQLVAEFLDLLDGAVISIHLAE